MKQLLFGFALLLLSAWLGLEVSRSAGYVLITYRHWSIETSLWVALILLLLGFSVFYASLRLLNRTLSLSTRWKQWRKTRLSHKSRHLTNQGLCELAEGRWNKAEKTLAKSAKITKKPLINYLALARAAQAQKAYDRRDNYLRQAHNATKGKSIAVDLTQAQLQIEGQQWDQALATLGHIQQAAPHQPYTLALLKNTYLQLADWKQLETLLPSLKRYKVLSDEALTELEERIYSSLLNQSESKDITSLQNTWNQIPRKCQHYSTVINAYIQGLMTFNESKTAANLIENKLKKQWDIGLVRRYGLIQTENPGKQLTLAEQWLKKHPKEPALLLCLGRLSSREKFWGKAKEYLENSLAIDTSAEAYAELGHVFTALGDERAALEAYRKGLAL